MADPKDKPKPTPPPPIIAYVSGDVEVTFSNPKVKVVRR